MLAPRAAAFDRRVKQVIGWSVFTNFKDILLSALPENVHRILGFCLSFHLQPVVNALVGYKISHGDELVKWGFLHGMYAYNCRTPYEYIEKMNEYQIFNIADRISQDVLILGATKDHFIDYHTVGSEINALTTAHSVSVRIFTEQECGEAHCNVGNTKLVCDTMLNWIAFMAGLSSTES